jgi:hypothetical protein
LDRDATWKIVRGVTGARVRSSARPNPRVQATLPPRTTATAAPGTRPSSKAGGTARSIRAANSATLAGGVNSRGESSPPPSSTIPAAARIATATTAIAILRRVLGTPVP